MSTENPDVDAIVSTLYLRFKSWSQRGFGPDDVTWCEVRADVLDLVRASNHSQISAAQVTLGQGLVDIARIEHEDRVGVLIRPRTEHAPYDGPGLLERGTYWPRPNDVVLWVSGDGPGVLVDALVSAGEYRDGLVE